MSRAYTLRMLEPSEEAGEWVVRAELKPPAGAPMEFWYAVPMDWKHAVTTRADPFLVGSLFHLMSAPADLRVEGNVSRELLRNVEEFMEVWACWIPGDLSTVSIEAGDVAADPARPDMEAVACCSGGLDGSFTVYRHASGLPGRRTRKLGAGVLIHGFDVPLENPGAFDQVAASVVKTLASLSLPLIQIRTNWRVHDQHWMLSHGAGIASCVNLLREGFGAGIIGSSENYSYREPWGSNPLTDPLLGGEGFRIVHDGAGYSRTEKVAVVAGWPEAVRNLRVCWEGVNKDENCGRCEKCVRTMLNFMAAGCPVPPCFGRELDLADIHRIPISPPLLSEFTSILKSARQRGLENKAWARSLALRIAQEQRGAWFQKITHAPRRGLRGLKSMLGLGWHQEQGPISAPTAKNLSPRDVIGSDSRNA